MDTQFQRVKNLVYELSERNQRRILKSLEFRLNNYAGGQGRDKYSEDDVVDYENNTNKIEPLSDSYKQKVKIITEIINKNDKDDKVFDIYARPEEVNKLCKILTVGQLNRLNFKGLCVMLRVATQSRDATNSTAYILTSYKNLLEQKDYKTKWQQDQKLDKERELLLNMSAFAVNKDVEF